MAVYFFVKEVRGQGREQEQRHLRISPVPDKDRSFQGYYYRDPAAYVLIIARYTNPY